MNINIQTMNVLKTFFALLIITPQFSCSQENKNQTYQVPYNLDSPDKKYILPPVLNEISGITVLSDELIIAVQDEAGILFYYDLKEQKISKQVNFGAPSDYEDVTLINDVIWVLRSDGRLFRVSNPESTDKAETTEFKTPLTLRNNSEGLCYDPIGKIMLIACKGDPSAGSNKLSVGYRAIYAFDPFSAKFTDKPVLIIDLQQVAEYRHSEKKKKDHGDHEKITIKKASFEPSAIAVHPSTNDIWVVASAGKALIIFSRDGKLKNYIKLRKEIFPQPEGITFSPDGTLFISSEGDGGHGLILKFEMEK